MMSIKKKIAQLAGACALLTLHASYAQANLLSNSGFDDDVLAPGGEINISTGCFGGNNTAVSPWTGFNCAFVRGEDFASSPTNIFKTFDIGAGDNGVFQDVAGIAPGDILLATVDAYNNSGDPLGAGILSLKIIWLDAGNGILGDVTTQGDASGTLDVDLSTQNVWTTMAVEGTAPVDTAAARFQIQFNPGAAAGGAGNFDNASLTVVPVPAAVWLFGSGLIGLVGLARRRKA